MGPTQLSPGQAEKKPWETGEFLSLGSGGAGWSAEKWWVPRLQVILFPKNGRNLQGEGIIFLIAAGTWQGEKQLRLYLLIPKNDGNSPKIPRIMT